MPLPHSKRKKTGQNSHNLQLFRLFITFIFLTIVLTFGVRSVLTSMLSTESISVASLDNQQSDYSQSIPDIKPPIVNSTETFGDLLDSSFVADTSRFAYFIASGTSTSKIYQLGLDTIKTLFITDQLVINPRVYNTGDMSFILKSNTEQKLVLYSNSKKDREDIYSADKQFSLRSHFFDANSSRFILMEEDLYGATVLSYLTLDTERLRIARTDQIPITASLVFADDSGIFFKDNQSCFLYVLGEGSVSQIDCKTIPENRLGISIQNNLMGISVFNQQNASSKQLLVNTVEYSIQLPFIYKGHVFYIADNKLEEEELYIGVYNLLTDTEFKLTQLPKEYITDMFIVQGQLYIQSGAEVFVYTQEVLQQEQPITNDGSWLTIHLDSPASHISLINQKDQ